MATESQPRLKITYATLRADNEQLHREYEAGLTEAKSLLDGHHPNVVAGSERAGDGEFTVRSPIDRDIVLGHFATGTRQDVKDVFAVISPFNFPMALSCGPSAAAMLAGNTVVFKPSSAAPMSGVKLVDAYREAGVPDGVINLVMGPGETVGAELRENPGVDGIVFTGS